MATFTVNGRTVTTEKNQKLIRFLRDELRLTSVKDGCSEGACGTCTILVDGKAVRACVLTTDRADGKTILTAEGLSEFEKEAYARGFGEAGAVQCGFCIPGMVMAAKGLLDQNPDPGEEEIKNALNALGNAVQYGIVLRAKGVVPCDDGSWLHFDYVPGEQEVRRGAAGVTGRLCVIGSELDEHELEELFCLD